MIWYPYTIQKSKNSPLKIVKSKGEFLYDSNGKEYIDAVSSWWVSVHGHNHPTIIQAIQKQLDELDQIILADFTHEPALVLAEKLLNFSENYFDKVFYSDNGSCAVEIALKIAYQYYKNIGMEGKQKIIKFSGSYHGDTIGAMSVGGFSEFNQVYEGMLLPNTIEFTSPDCYNCPVNKDDCGLECISALEQYIKLNHSSIACVIMEPLIQGAGGFKIYKKEVLEKISTLCREYNVLLILDEVFTGFGRTGKNFAYQNGEIYPDIISVAKGLSGGVLPIAATLVTKKVYDAFYSEEPIKAFYHGHSMTGNPPSCAASIASIELFSKENRLQQVQELEVEMKSILNSLQNKYPDKVKNIRALGAVAAFDLKIGQEKYSNPIGKVFSSYCLEKGVIVRPLGNVVYLTPPYIISKESIYRVSNALDSSLSLLK